MKSYEAFSASVYAKAKTKRAQVKARNRRLRNSCVSALCVVVLAVAAVPLSRSITQAPPAVVTPTTESVEPRTRDMNQYQPLGAQNSPRTVVFYDSQEGENTVMLLENQQQKQAFISEFRQNNNIAAYEVLPVIPAVESAVIIHSTEELAEFLVELPQDCETLQEIVYDYDYDFFLQHNLYAMPMGVGALPTDLASMGIQLLSIEENDIEPAYEPLEPDEDYPEPTESTEVPGTEPTTNESDEYTQAPTEPATQPFPHSNNPYARVLMLLLVPMNK